MAVLEALGLLSCAVGGIGLHKLSVYVSQRRQKPLAENTHRYMRARSQSAHTYQLSERQGRVRLFPFSADTLLISCAMFSHLSLLQCWYPEAWSVLLSITVSRRESSQQARGICTLCAHSTSDLQTTASHWLLHFKNWALCRSLNGVV